MEHVLATAPELGTVGMAILAVILAIFLALKSMEVYKRTNGRASSSDGNGNGNGISKSRLDQLRMLCPFGTGRRSLDDVHEVLVSMCNKIDDLRGSQEQLAKDTRAIHLEIARKGD